MGTNSRLIRNYSVSLTLDIRDIKILIQQIVYTKSN